MQVNKEIQQYTQENGRMNEFKIIEHKIDYFLLIGNLEQNTLGSV